MFKRSGLYKVDKSVVEHRNVITGNDTGDVTQLLISTTAETFLQQSSTPMVSSTYVISPLCKGLK